MIIAQVLCYILWPLFVDPVHERIASSLIMSIVLVLNPSWIS